MSDLPNTSCISKNRALKLMLIAVITLSFAFYTVPSGTYAADNGTHPSSEKLTDDNQAIERAKQLHLLPEEKVTVTTKKLTEPEDAWQISYNSRELDEHREPKHLGFIVLSAANGELLSYSAQVKISLGSCPSPCMVSEPEVHSDEALAAAISYFDKLDFNLDADWTLTDYPISEYYRGKYYPSHIFSFTRSFEGVPFLANGISIEVNGWTGEVSRYSVRWDNVKFAKPSDLISYAEAGRLFYDAIEPTLFSSIDLRDPENLEKSKLVYITKGFYLMDAKGKFAEEQAPEPAVNPEDTKPKYSAEYAKHRLLSLYELELVYRSTMTGQAEPFYQLYLKPGVPLYYYEPHPYIDAENGGWINFLHDPLPVQIPAASDWLIDQIVPTGKVNYKAAVVWNNELLKLNNEPIIHNGFTLVPFRELLSQLGAKITWDPVKRKVSASKNGTTIELTIDSDIAYVNGQPHSLGAPARITKGHTYIPARMVLEAFGAKVNWNADSRLVLVQTDAELPKPTNLELDRLRLHAQLNWEEHYWKP